MNFTAMPLTDRIGKWYELKEQIAELNKQEKALRLSIFEEAFPTLKEGTAHLPLNPGWKLTGAQPLSYTLDTTHLEYMRVELHKLGVSLDPLIRWKAELNVKPYKNMPDNARLLFNNILTIKEGLPTIKIVPASDAEEATVDEMANAVHKQAFELLVTKMEEVFKETVIKAAEEVETPSVTMKLVPKKTRARKAKAKE